MFRWNSDEDIRRSERLLIYGDVNDYIAYWAKLARNGYGPAIDRIKIVQWLERNKHDVSIKQIESILIKKYWKLVPVRIKISIIQSMIGVTLNRQYPIGRQPHFIAERCESTRFRDDKYICVYCDGSLLHTLKISSLPSEWDFRCQCVCGCDSIATVDEETSGKPFCETCNLWYPDENGQVVCPKEDQHQYSGDTCTSCGMTRETGHRGGNYREPIITIRVESGYCDHRLDDV